MIALMEPERVGDIAGLTAMGNEGAQWIGMAPFVDRDHMVQNLGDGTFFHSGSLAIRAAVRGRRQHHLQAALQRHRGDDRRPGPAGAAARARGGAARCCSRASRRVIITTEDPDAYDDAEFGEHRDRVEVWHRGRLLEAQEVLATVPGVTVLVHDQACAAENRRARSRGRLAKPGFRVVINERVCEGCGDCGDKSNCLSVQPVETPYGRKTRIHQTSCNFDMSCLTGDCPAFATVTVERRRVGTGGRARPGRARRSRRRPARRRARWCPATSFTVRLSGIGGTGVMTVSQILGTAAMLEGNVVRGLDQTGLSQKAGPVVSDVRVSANAVPTSNQANSAGVDCLLAFDLLAAASDAHRNGARADRTVVVGSAAPTPTGTMVAHPDDALPRARHPHRPPDGGVAPRAQPSTSTPPRCRPGCSATPRRPTSCCSAWPCRPAPCRRRRRPSSGRSSSTAWRSNATAPPSAGGGGGPTHPHEVEQAAGLTDAGARDARRADRPPRGRPRRLPVGGLRPPLPRARRAGPRRPSSAVDPASTLFTEAVARNLHKLMAYKDEYEVARLLLLPEARQAYEAVGGRRTKVTWRLHPPTLRALGLQGQDAVRAGVDADVPGAAPGQAGARHASPTRSVGPRCAASSGR